LDCNVFSLFFRTFIQKEIKEVNIQKMRILIHSFYFVGKTIEKYLHTSKFYYYSYQGNFLVNIIGNLLDFRKKLKTKFFDKYDIIHINAWENIINIPPKNKRKNQIWIAETHGLHIGFNDKSFYKTLLPNKRALAFFISIFTKRKMIKKIKSADIYYVSTPNLLSAAKLIRPDVEWLPNPINLDIFKPTGKTIKLEGNPSIFLPTRLHKNKNSLFIIKLLNKIINEFPESKITYVDYGKKSPDETKFIKTIEKNHCKKCEFLSQEKLATYFRSADLIIGQFSDVAGNGLIELQAMACKAPLVSYDIYETIKVDRKDLPKYAIKLINNKTFRTKEIKRNYEYVSKVHNPKTIAKQYLKNIQEVIKSK